MPKAVLITDTHFGFGKRGKNDKFFMEHINKFFTQVFFPYLKKHKDKIDAIIHLGDVVDHRQFITPEAAAYTNRIFRTMKEIVGCDIDIIIGNHDCKFKTTNKLNFPSQLELCRYARVHENPTAIFPGGKEVLVIPWINPENVQLTKNLLSVHKKNDGIVMGHLELIGFEHHTGHVATHGDDKSLFDGYSMVLSGHYHKKSSRDNIHYLGAPYELTWNDYGDRKGFHVLDLETRELEFRPNPHTAFLVINDGDSDMLAECEGKIVDVLTTPDNLDSEFIKKVQEKGFAVNPVTADTRTAKRIDENILDIGDLADTEKIIEQYIENMNLNDTNIDHGDLTKFVKELYTESMTDNV